MRERMRTAALAVGVASLVRDELDALRPEWREAVLEAGLETTDYALTRMVALVGETCDKKPA